MIVVVRPIPWSPPPEGFHFEAVEQGPEWKTPSIGAGRCRFQVGRKACGKPTVATLMRPVYRHTGTKAQPWDYCADHLYGRWLEDGKVMGWRLIRDDAAAV